MCVKGIYDTNQVFKIVYPDLPHTPSIKYPHCGCHSHEWVNRTLIKRKKILKEAISLVEQIFI